MLLLHTESKALPRQSRKPETPPKHGCAGHLHQHSNPRSPGIALEMGTTSTTNTKSLLDVLPSGTTPSASLPSPTAQLFYQQPFHRGCPKNMTITEPPFSSISSSHPRAGTLRTRKNSRDLEPPSCSWLTDHPLLWMSEFLPNRTGREQDFADLKKS